jgi:hypothetical protein
MASQSAAQKKNKKKRAEAQAEAAPKSEAAAAFASDDGYDEKDEKIDERVLRQSIAEAAWETVVNVKKEKRAARIARKQGDESNKKEDGAAANGIAGAPAAGEAGGSDGGGGGNKKAKKKKNKDGAQAQGKGDSQEQAKKKKKKKKPAAQPVRRPQTDEQMVEVIASVLRASPSDYLQAAALGNRIQAVLNDSWNKSFKPKFGSLKDFLLKQSAAFHYDEHLDRVFLRQVYNKRFGNAAEARRENKVANEADANERKDKAGQGGAEQPRSPNKASRKAAGSAQAVRNRGDGDGGSGDAGSVLVKTIGAGVLLVSVVFGVLVYTNGGSVDRAVAQIRTVAGL